MRLSLFYFIQYWTLLGVTSVYFTSCLKGTKTSELVLRDELMRPSLEASAYITGIYHPVGKNGHITSEATDHPKDLAKAHQLLVELRQDLTRYPNITRHAIAQTILADMDQQLRILEQDIDTLPNGPEKNQFNTELGQLTQCINKAKGVSTNSETHDSSSG